MTTIDEILAAMPEPSAEGDHEYLVIDPAKRAITVPEAEKIFGVTGDELADRKYFICPRIVGDGLDLASMFIRVNFRNANGEEDGYLVTDVAVSGDYVTFSWQLWPKVVAYKGAILFGVCADLPNTPDRKMPDWNTTMASGDVLEGLDPVLGDVEAETSDVVTQLRAEITAGTAAVEACGAAQVDVVEATGAAATAEAVAAIQAQGEATKASIPADYTTLANKSNEQANAIKGHMFGQIVRADDVSPVEHYLGVNVRSKNHFIASKIGTTTKFIKNDDGTVTVLAGQYSCQTGLQLKTLCPFLAAGKTAVLSIDTDGLDFIYSNGVLRHGVPFVVTEEILDGYVAIYGAEETDADFETAHTIRYIQIEEGTVATEYTPYIDPATVTVTRCGKNLIDSALMAETKTLNGVTITREGDLLTLNGTLTTDSVLFSTPFCFYGGLDNWYTLSYKHMGGTATGSSSVCVGDCETPGAARQSWANIKMLNEDNAFACKMVKPFVKDLWFYATAGVSFENYKIKIQLETGKTATAFAPCNGTTAMPASDGTVAGLASVAPTMTLLTDTAGVVIDCTYNRDTNAVLAEILEKIAALSG